MGTNPSEFWFVEKALEIISIFLATLSAIGCKTKRKELLLREFLRFLDYPPKGWQERKTEKALGPKILQEREILEGVALRMCV